MMTNKVKRILTYLQANGTEPALALFDKCIFDQLENVLKSFNTKVKFCGQGLDEKLGIISVHCNLFENKLILEPLIEGSEPNATTVQLVLKHPPLCPVRILTESQRLNLSDETKQRGINVGVAVILESSDNCTLLTRRATHMRTFPGVWVPPGGHIDLDESLESAGLRELNEETGLHITLKNSQSDYAGYDDTAVSSSISAVKCSKLTLWESVYPALLERGLPERHHIVVYIHVVVEKTSVELTKLIQLDPNEVDSCFWLRFSFAEKCFIEDSDSSPKESESIQCIIVDQNKKQKYCPVESEKIQQQLKQKSLEKMSFGTMFALEMWCKRKLEASGVCKSNL